MDFTFSDEQRMGAEAARQVLADLITPGALRKRMAQAGTAQDEGLWRRIADAGLTGVLVPESAGGLGLSEPDFILIAEACGYAALPEPLVEHAGVAAPLLAAIGAGPPSHGAAGMARHPEPALVQRTRGGFKPAVLSQAATGEVRLAVGHSINPFVADADTAYGILVEHVGEVHWLEPSSAKLTREDSIDPFRRLFRVDWTPSATTRITDAKAGANLWGDALDRGSLFTAAQCLGLAQRAVDLAVDYAKERQQFGKPIGSYQAIKHLLANVQVKIEFARPVVHAAAAEFPARDAMSRARISHAKLAAADAADLAVRTALQVHGAMGYSWEVDLHFFLKRALALSCAWGTPAFHRRRVAARVFDHPIGPEHTFARERPEHDRIQSMTASSS